MNEKIINEFIQHLQDGKPILNRKKNPIADKTASKYRRILNQLSKWFNKDFNNITEEDIVDFRKRLKNNTIKNEAGKSFSNNTKRDIEVKVLAVLFKWMKKPELAYYTDDYKQDREIPALTRSEVEKIITTVKLRDKVIIALLFDGGFRADEFLNIRFCDVKDDERKSKGYYKVRIVKSKTKARTVGLYLDFSADILDQWISANKDKIGTSDRLVSISYNHLRMNIKRIGERVLKKKLYPHLLRHSSATYYCHKLNNFQLCKRYGWSMASDMPAVYIDREGVEEAEIGTKINEEEALKYKKEVNVLKEQMRINEEQMQQQSKTIEMLSLKLETLDDIEEALKTLQKVKQNKP